MGDVRLRLSLPGDERAFVNIWSAVFGDGEEYIKGFLRRLYEPGRAAVAEVGGNIVSMAFFPEIGELVFSSGERKKCSYIYAVATLPKYRGRGLGAAVSCLAALKAKEDGAVVICPAEEGLFGFYEKACGFETLFYADETEEFRHGEKRPPAEKITAGEYFALREKLLAGRTHICFSERASEYQAHLCRNGGFFRAKGGIFAAEKQGDTVFVKEALGDEARELFVGGAEGERYIVRSPGKGRPFAMFLPERGVKTAGGEPAWFGFAFD